MAHLLVLPEFKVVAVTVTGHDGRVVADLLRDKSEAPFAPHTLVCLSEERVEGLSRGAVNGRGVSRHSKGRHIEQPLEGILGRRSLFLQSGIDTFRK